MNQKFSTSWKASIQPRKQRKYTANAPLHLRHKLLSVSLSKELRKKYGKRSLPIRKNDTAKIITGNLKKKQGKVLNVDLKKLKVTIEGIQVKKQDGSKVNLWIQPSNLQITELNLDDRKRLERLTGKRAPEKKEEKPEKVQSIKKTKVKEK